MFGKSFDGQVKLVPTKGKDIKVGDIVMVGAPATSAKVLQRVEKDGQIAVTIGNPNDLLIRQTHLIDRTVKFNVVRQETLN